MEFQIVFYVGVMIIAVMINTVQAAKAKRFSFRQIVSLLQVIIYASVAFGYVATGGYSANFRYWSMLGFFFCAFAESAELALILKNGIPRETPIPAVRQSEQRGGGILGKIRNKGEENPQLVTALSVSIALVLSVGICLVSLSLVTGYIPSFLMK